MKYSFDRLCALLRACVFSLGLVGAVHAQSGELPSDVKALLERRESCSHWGGEEPYDKARRAEIFAGVCADCLGTDARLAQLKQRYALNPQVMAALNALEPRVEMPELSRLCRRVNARR